IALFIIREDAPVGGDSGLAAGGTTAPAGAPIQASAVNRRTATGHIRIRDALQSAQFWKIVIGLFACGYSMNLLGTHGVPMLMDHGFDAMTGSFGIGLIGFAAIFSTLVLGRLSDV